MNNEINYKYIKSGGETYSIKTSPTFIEWCMVISVILMPYTALKTVGPMGPSEFLILVAFFSQIYQNGIRLDLNRTYISKLYFAYVIVCALGSLWNIGTPFLLKEKMNGTYSGMLFDMLSYFFILITIYTFEMHREDNHGNIDEETMLRYIVNINCIAMPALYILGLYRSTLFGMRLKYYSYFAPLAANLHHTSMYLLPIVFATVYLGEKQKNFLKKILYYFFAVFFSFLAISTGSTKAVIGVFAGAITCIFYKVTTRDGMLNRYAKTVLVITLILVLIYIFLDFSKVSNIAITSFQENDLGGGRQKIWSTALNIWKESPIIGYGFGAHVEDATVAGVYWDAHNTFIATLLQGGIIGFIIIVIMWINIFREFVYNGFLLALVVSLFVYFTGGDVLRRIPTWSFLIIIHYIMQNNINYTIVSIRNNLMLHNNQSERRLKKDE